MSNIIDFWSWKELTQSDVICLDDKREWFIPSMQIDENCAKVDTIINFDSIQILLQQEKFHQFKELVLFQFSEKDREQWRVFLKSIQATIFNFIFDKVKADNTTETLEYILLLYKRLSIFSDQLEKEYDFIFFTDEYLDAFEQQFITSIDQFIKNTEYKPNRKYKNLANIYSRVLVSNHKPTYNLPYKNLWLSISTYFYNVFTSYLCYEAYDELSVFCLSDDAFKVELDVDYIKYKLFTQIRNKLESCSSQESASGLMHCIKNLCYFFNDRDKQFFVPVFLKSAEQIFSQLPEFDNVFEFSQKEK